MRCTIVRIHRWFLFVDGPLNGFYRDIRDKSMQLLYLFVNIDQSIAIFDSVCRRRLRFLWTDTATGW